jgi:hypothetical protein
LLFSHFAFQTRISFEDSLLKLEHCGKNRDGEGFKKLFTETAATLKRLFNKSEDIAKNLKHPEISKKLFAVLRGIHTLLLYIISCHTKNTLDSV